MHLFNLCVFAALWALVSSSEVKIAYDLSDDDQEVLMRRHLAYRSFVDPPASDMMFLMWDEGLAKESVAVSRRCLYEHSQLKSENFKFVGENIFLTGGISIDDEWFQLAVDEWAGEMENFKYDEGCEGNCAHYTQVVWATTHKVGCGLTICDSVTTTNDIEFVDAAILVCRYGPAGNVRSLKVRPYETGPPCFDCDLDEKCVLNSCTNVKRDGTSDLTKWERMILRNPNSAELTAPLSSRNLFLLTICIGISSHILE